MRWLLVVALAFGVPGAAGCGTTVVAQTGQTGGHGGVAGSGGTGTGGVVGQDGGSHCKPYGESCASAADCCTGSCTEARCTADCTTDGFCGAGFSPPCCTG